MHEIYLKVQYGNNLSDVTVQVHNHNSKRQVLKSTIISLSHKETPTNTFTQAEINIRNMYDSTNIGTVQLCDVKEQLSN